MKLRPGSYSVRTRVTYRTYKFVTKHRNVTTPVTHDPDGVANTPGAAQNVSCVVVAVQDGYPQTGTCTTPDYPGQTVTIDDVSDWCGVEDYAGTAVAGDIVHDNDCYGLSGSGDFHAYTTMQTVVRTYTVKQYTGAGHYTTPKRPLRVKDGGLLRMYSGAGVHATGTFTVPDHTWHIGYAFDCSGFGQAGNFIIYVYRGRHLVDVAANRLAASGTGANTEYGSGTYHLQVISECTWSVAVK